MNTFGWRLRLKYATAAAGLGWLVGWLISFPFELSLAWRYVDGDPRRMPLAVGEGLVVWAGFSLFMAMAGFLPMILPCFLLIPPRWIVRWRALLIPGAALAGFLAIDERMGFLHLYRLRHPEAVRAFFFSAPNFFVISFALVVVWLYSALAKRRLESAAHLTRT
jgi:hypothetical protein